MTETEALASLPADAELSVILNSEEGTALWEAWLAASRLTALMDLAISSAEPAHLTKYALQLAQQFIYHRFHILTEEDPDRRAVLLATAVVARRELVRVLGYLGIAAPAVM